jgi:hypothetical protein
MAVDILLEVTPFKNVNIFDGEIENCSKATMSLCLHPDHVGRHAETSFGDFYVLGSGCHER